MLSACRRYGNGRPGSVAGTGHHACMVGVPSLSAHGVCGLHCANRKAPLERGLWAFSCLPGGHPAAKLHYYAGAVSVVAVGEVGCEGAAADSPGDTACAFLSSMLLKMGVFFSAATVPGSALLAWHMAQKVSMSVPFFVSTRSKPQSTT